jgi:hypothetical protein
VIADLTLIRGCDAMLLGAVGDHRSPRHREHGVRPGNTEEPYAGTGGRIRRGSPDEIALQYSVNTLAGVRRAGA